MKKVIFMGTPQFSVPVLEALINDKTIEVIAVVTQPDRKVGRKQEFMASPVKQLALEHEISVYQPEKISNSDEIDKLIALKPDLIITTAYGQFVPTKLLNAPKYRSINVHASLLPMYRGAAPIHYAVLNGDEKTGITIMYMEREMDAGNIISQREIPITDKDNTGTLFDKLSLVGRDLLMDTLPDIFSGKNKSIVQDESQVSFSPMISKEQERIDWNQSARDVFNHIRALYPVPGAYTLLDGERFKIWKADLTKETAEKSPGTIVEITDNNLFVVCGDRRIISLKVVQPAGKQRLKIEDYLLGTNIKVGEFFE